MAESLLTDDLLREIIAVGQVDILVGVPTMNNASSVGAVVRAVHRSFGTHFRRERTVLINCDFGSTDGTPDIVRDASLRDSETVIAAQGLRTEHGISIPYHGLPGRGSSLQTLFAAADLLQARVVALFDADVPNITPDWVSRLISPVLQGDADFVAPIYIRHPLDGSLVTQLVRPMMRAAYGSRLREPLASEFACSGTYAAHCVAQDIWRTPLMEYGVDLWLTATALSESFRCAEAPLGARVHMAKSVKLGLPEVFRQVVGSLFGCLEMHQTYWTKSTGSSAVPTFGVSADSPPTPPFSNAEEMLESFRSGVGDLSPILAQILLPETLDRILSLRQTPGAGFRYSDPLWVSTVYEAAGAHHRGVMHRDHLTQALVPLYLGRVASFLMENAARDEQSVEEALEALGLQFESSKPYLLERWSSGK